jgi:hypothetical protein
MVLALINVADQYTHWLLIWRGSDLSLPRTLQAKRKTRGRVIEEFDGSRKLR